MPFATSFLPLLSLVFMHAPPPFHPKIERKKVVLIHKNISSMGKGGANFLEFFIENIWSLTQNLLHLCSCKAQIYKPKARMKYS